MRQQSHKYLTLEICTAVLLVACIGAEGSDTITLKGGCDYGESNYYVHNTDLANLLESKLVFPIRSDWIGIEYRTDINDITVKLGGIEQIRKIQETQKGEDYDWQNGIPTIYSYSDNSITRNQSVYAEISKKVDIGFINTVALKMVWKNLDFKWRNTYQENYTDGTAVLITGDTLTYSQKMRKIGLLLFSNKEKANFLYNGWVHYYDVESKDTHLLRNLATTMANKGFGYEIKGGYQYVIGSSAKLKFLLTYEKFEDDGPMKYYSNGLYVTSYPSRMEYETLTPSISFEYEF